jgi:class 3 adenylate cyclase
MPSRRPETRYAKSWDLNIAYQVVGEGPLDLTYASGWIPNVELAWEEPAHAHVLDRLASFSRLILFDKRGTGMSDPVVGSTEQAKKLGDRRWRELLERHHTLVRQQLDRFKGREIDTAGDGFFAAFDGPARAIRCGYAIESGLRGLGLEVGAGVHTGECELFGEKVAGLAVHTGARIAI